MKIRMFVFIGSGLLLTACGNNSSSAGTPKNAPAAFGIAITGCAEEALCLSPQVSGGVDAQLE
jgi:hypothetical protein